MHAQQQRLCVCQWDVACKYAKEGEMQLRNLVEGVTESGSQRINLVATNGEHITALQTGAILPATECLQ